MTRNDYNRVISRIHAAAELPCETVAKWHDELVKLIDQAERFEEDHNLNPYRFPVEDIAPSALRDCLIEAACLDVYMQAYIDLGPEKRGAAAREDWERLRMSWIRAWEKLLAVARELPQDVFDKQTTLDMGGNT